LKGQSQSKPRGTIERTYDYTDENGDLLYQVVRFFPKDFRQRQPDGKGDWIWNLEGARRIPYRLPDLLKYPFGTVFVTEGEKDADRLAELDLCSTTVAGGKWTDKCVQAFAGRDIIVLEDNDDAGEEKALIAATALHGVASTIRIVKLPGLPEKGDVSDWLDASRHNNAEKLVDLCFAAPPWNPGNQEQPANEQQTVTGTTDTEPPLPFIDVCAWHDRPVPEREWAVKDRIPLRAITLFSGEGAIGKSIVSLQLAVAHVLGKDWLQSLPEPGPALVVACEDEADKLHRRLSAIVAHYGASFAELGRFHAVSLAGEDALLATPTRSGLIEPTKLFSKLQEAACDIRPQLIVLDNSADVFGGSENDRAQVRQFIGILRGLAIAANAGILLTSHPSLTGLSTGSGLSGSTAWHASVRSRLYMKRAVTEKDEEPDPNVRVIEMMKSNYGPIGETITVRWQDGLFLPEASLGFLDKAAAEQSADELFLKLLDRFQGQGRNVSHAKTSNNYAPTMFAKDTDAKGKRKELAEAMERLFRADRIKAEPYGRGSKPASRLVRC
jgi:RecA-family ATPase